jgi:hypothetical protein
MGIFSLFSKNRIYRVICYGTNGDKMLKESPELKREFEQKIATDKFAANPNVLWLVLQ